MPWKGLSDPERFTDYTWSAAGLKCGSGMRRPSRYRVGGKNAGCFGSREASVGVCGRHEGSARKWCWKRRWEMPRQGRACYAALGLEPIPWATGSQFLVLCHQLHVNPVLAALHRTLRPVLGRPSTSAFPHSRQGEKKCDRTRYPIIGITSTLLA